MNTDTYFYLLLNAPIENIEALCLTSKDAYDWCNDAYFWKEKFKHDHVPMLSTEQHDKRMIDWVDEYIWSLAAKKDASLILYINEIEQKRIEDILDGKIYIDYNYYYLVKHLHETPFKIIHELVDEMILRMNDNHAQIEIALMIEPLDKDYKIQMNVGVFDDIIALNAVYNKNEVLQLLIHALFLSLKIKDATHIYTINHGTEIPLLGLNIDIIIQLYSFNADAYRIALQRLGIIDTLSYLQK